MLRRREISRVDPKDVRLEEASDLSNSLVQDHLTAKVQELIAQAKKFKTRHNYAFRSAKNSVVYLRYMEDSCAIKVKDHKLTDKSNCIFVKIIFVMAAKRDSKLTKQLFRELP